MSAAIPVVGPQPAPPTTADQQSRRIPSGISRNRAIRLVLNRAPDLVCTNARMVHHPYAGYIYAVQQRAFGRSLHGVAHILVDRCSGGTSTSDPWPDPVLLEPGETLDAVPATISEEHAEDGARQCAVRTALHRRRALIPIEVTSVSSAPLLYKPNWLLDLQLPADGGTVKVLVDALTGAYHLVPGGVVQIEPAAAG
ncbi:hypothetical protein [Cryobacterium sp. Y82]|uniref:hypothetical protein n=1 Tax=Cryobacterium sp. Y82 TaxID=2045017 RepID=UPI000CE49026|nr:hypothetical protein [Cryobacterium sp. Y82]